MQSRRAGNSIIVKVEAGDEIIASLIAVCVEHKVACGSFSGIGATNDADVGYFDLSTKSYEIKKFSGSSYEITSLQGNITQVDGAPAIHPHITLGDRQHRAFGGHLMKGIVNIACEIIIHEIDAVVERKMDDRFGLKMMQL